MLQTAAKTLLEDSSIELSTNGETAIRAAAAVLPARTVAYVPKLPRETLQDKLVQIKLLNVVGFRPVPHIVARRLQSAEELKRFLNAARAEANVQRVLVIGGDESEAAGPYADSAAVIASGILRDLGIREVDVAGYPDGHPKIPQSVLAEDLRNKVSLAEQEGLRLSVVTQFSFSADAIAEYCAYLQEQGINVPVYAGLAGPTSPTQLLRFASICGVSTSIKAANKLGMNALKLATNTTPDRHFDVLAGHMASGQAGRLAGVHIFSFGGFVKSAEWLDGKARRSGLRL